MVGLNEGSFPDFRNMDNEGIEPSNDSCMWQSPGHPEPYGCGARECDAFGTWYQDAAAPTLINLLCRGPSGCPLDGPEIVFAAHRGIQLSKNDSRPPQTADARVSIVHSLLNRL